MQRFKSCEKLSCTCDDLLFFLAVLSIELIIISVNSYSKAKTTKIIFCLLFVVWVAFCRIHLNFVLNIDK